VEIERDGADETHHDEFVARHAVRHEHRLAGEFLITGELPQAQGPTDEDVVRARLRQEEEEKQEAEGGQPHELPDWPRPGCGDVALKRSVLHCEAPDQRTECGTADRGDAPDAHRVRSLAGGIEIRHRRSARRENRTTEEPSEEAESEQHSEVTCQSRGHLERNEDDEGAQVDGVAADVGDLAHGAPEHGSQAVAGDEEGEA